MRAFFYYIVITPTAAKKSAKKLSKNLVNPKKSSTFAPFKLKYSKWQTGKWLLQRQFFLLLWCQHRRLLPNTLCESCNGLATTIWNWFEQQVVFGFFV